LTTAAPLHFGSSQTLVPPPSANRVKLKKGTGFNPDFVYLRKQIAQEFFAKAGSNSASEF
jgi:hypothetical protein